MINSFPDYNHKVIVSFYKGINDLSELHKLDMKLYKFLTNPEIGYYDGHEVAMDLSHGTLFFYGNNAEILFKAVKPMLETAEFLVGATANLVFNSQSKNRKSIEVIIGDN